MFPTQPQIPGKRKAEESNPLLNAAAAAKRAKKDAVKLGSMKRKLNREETLNSLRPSLSQPTNTADTHPLPRFSSQPSMSSILPQQPPSKKLRPDSQTRTHQRRPDTAASDVEVEKDVRAMDDEADKLRRLSRARTTIDSSLLQGNVRFPETPGSSRKGKSKAVDTLVPLTEQETPTIERNKQMRAGAMATIANGRNQEGAETGSTTPHGQRRKSSVSGRGKRVSTSFEASGIITQPHNSVSETSFYKHIDADLSDCERIRQLLIWCSLRTLSGNPSSNSGDLPALNGEAVKLLKLAQEDVVRRLAEKKIELDFYSSGSSSQAQGDLRENEQNVRNRKWEVSYTNEIQRAQGEEEAWKKVSYEYDGYGKKLRSFLEERSGDLEAESGGISSKAKGKRRASAVLEDEVGEEFHPAVSLARCVLGVGSAEDGGRRGKTRTGKERGKVEEEISRLLERLEYTVDRLYSQTNAAKTTSDIAERMLNERFEVLTWNSSRRPDGLDMMRALTRVD